MTPARVSLLRWVWSRSPASSTNEIVLVERNATLSKPLWFSFDRKKSDSFPVFADGLDWVRLWIAPQPPEPPAPVVLSPFSTLRAFVSPVSSKKNCLKPAPGRNWPFSGA